MASKVESQTMLDKGLFCCSLSLGSCPREVLETWLATSLIRLLVEFFRAVLNGLGGATTGKLSLGNGNFEEETLNILAGPGTGMEMSCFTDTLWRGNPISMTELSDFCSWHEKTLSLTLILSILLSIQSCWCWPSLRDLEDFVFICGLILIILGSSH